MDDVLIIGGGIAALSAARAAREVHPDCSITILSGETYAPYARPMLTKLPLTRFQTERYALERPDFRTRSRIRTNTQALAIHPQDCTVHTASGVYAYSRLILATGASAFLPPIPGAACKGVFTLRTPDDLHAIARCALRSRQAVVIGGGAIGLEAAYQLSDFGLQTTVLETAPYLMPRLLDRESAGILTSNITRFTVKTGVNVTAICGTDRAAAVAVEGMEPIPAQLVLFCCGVQPNTELVRTAGIAVNRGILVDERMQTSVSGIYACGDCTEFHGGNTGLWPQAMEQGRVAGVNAAGGTAVYTGSDPALLMNCPEFNLYVQGDLGRDPSKVYTVKSKTTTRSPMLELNGRSHTGLCREYELGDRLVGVFLLGDLTSMPRLRRAMEEQL